MLKMNMCLRRLTGSRRLFWSLGTTDYNRCVSNNTILVIPTTATAFSFGSHASSRGLASEFIENTKSIHCQLEEAKERRCDHDIKILPTEEKQLKIIEKGDIVNLSELLFTKNRDYLIRYKDPRLVTADQLAGKVVVIYFVRQDPYSSRSSGEDTCTTSLIDVYNDLKHKNCFEVVFVFVDSAFDSINEESFYNSSLPSDSQIFEDIFSHMPWTAIPFSDITLRKYLEKRFGLHKVCESTYPIGFVIDSTGMVLQTRCEHIIDRYGSPAYPFSDERLAFLDSEDEVVAKQPSLKTLLVSAQRDYVISNKWEKVPIHTLEDKVVALYFYKEDLNKYNQTEELKTAYKKLAKNNENFEVVLIYLTDTNDTYKCTNEETFRKTFKTMPWLALPFKDPIHKKLKRLFDYHPIKHPDVPRIAPSLVIFGPQGKFIEPCGAEVLSRFGVSAYPFTRENLVKLETEKFMELKLEMLCSPTTVLKRKDGSQIQFSHLAGKRVMFYSESVYWDDVEDPVTFKEGFKFVMVIKEVEFLTMLKERYLQMKGTDDEFEVIYIPHCTVNGEFCYNELIADVPWFVLPLSGLLADDYAFLTYCGKFYFEDGWSFLLAFGQDGRLVRRTVCPNFKHVDYPFYAGSLEAEAYDKLSHHFFCDGYWNMYYEGLLRNSFDRD